MLRVDPPDDVPVDPRNSTAATLQDLHNSLRRRAGRRRNLGYFCLFIIAAAMIAGGAFYWFAQSLTAQDSAETFRQQRELLEEGLAAAQRRAASAAGQVQEAQGHIRTRRASHNTQSEWRHGFPGYLRSIAMAGDSGQVAMAVGNSGQLVRTADGGTTWQPVKTPAQNMLNSVVFANA